MKKVLVNVLDKVVAVSIGLVLLMFMVVIIFVVLLYQAISVPGWPSKM